MRVAPGRDGMTRAAAVTKSTPHERLRSISFASPDSEKNEVGTPASPSEGAVMRPMSGIMKDGKLIAKTTAVRIAATSAAQLTANAPRKSNLVSATDKAVHTLMNQRHNGCNNVSENEHNAVASALVDAGNGVLGRVIEDEPIATVEVVVAVAALPAAPALSDRIRELSQLHQKGDPVGRRIRFREGETVEGAVTTELNRGER